MPLRCVAAMSRIGRNNGGLTSKSGRIGALARFWQVYLFKPIATCISYTNASTLEKLRARLCWLCVIAICVHLGNFLDPFTSLEAVHKF